jgi:hypothetical protein
MSRILFQIGSVKNRKRTQFVKAYINDIEQSWSDGNGQFLTSHKDRVARGMTWYMCDVDLQQEDVLKIEAKTFLPGIGLDEEKTFESLYYANEESPVRSIEITEVGFKGYPLIKGRILEIGSVSEMDKRKADLEEFMNEGF